MLAVKKGFPIMKIISFVLAVALASVIGLTGCGKKSSVDTSNLDKSFQSAPAPQRSDADKAISAIKAGNYSDAMASLQNLAKQVDLTPEQKQAVKDVIQEIQKAMSDMAAKAGDEAQKATSNLPSMPK